MGHRAGRAGACVLGGRASRQSEAEPRFQTALLAAFAGLALLLAVGGIYSVVSRVVSDRTRDIGIRMAIGARPAHIVALVAKRECLLALAGLVIGLAAAFALARLMRSMLFEVGPTDPLTFLAVADVFVVAVALACAVPSRRAIAVNPATALRADP